MKKITLTKTMTAALIATTLSSALMPKSAHAGICYYFTHADVSTEDKWERVQHQKKFVWIAMLPVMAAVSAISGPIGSIPSLLIFLDQKVDQVPQFTARDLLNNGYSSEEVAQIESDEYEFANALKSKNAAIGLEAGDSTSTIRGLIKEVYPQASEMYLNLKSEQMSLAAQAFVK